MGKTDSRKTGRRAVNSTSQQPPALKSFRPISWYDESSSSRYVSHLFQELGRLGLDVHDIERRDRPPHTQTVLSDLIDWLDEPPGQSFAKLVNWQALDLPLISSRLEKDRSAKPRIEISAHITKMNNLSVRWYPDGWRRSVFVCDFKNDTSPNLIPRHKWSEAPDFRWFVGDEDPTFDARPTNELMYLRGVGSLDPSPDTHYGPYAGYNRDVVDSILICAVRSAYERLIEQCRLVFEVELLDAFDFSLCDEIDGTDSFSRQFPLHRVVSWSLKDAAELRLQRERETEERERVELANVPASFGFSLESLIAAVMRASQRKSAKLVPTEETINRNAAKDLRGAGFKVDAGDVRRIRRLIERYSPALLPKELRPTVATAETPPLDNVLRFPTKRV